ncbi:LLM class flavin-dependent oxidoreductase [Streptomyces sp. BK239]|uniref:LLM class flavin-dependent oxidoreductase n=1 Tax=Streptomyces sp. BK239 TaxID=2512155 RepID=UPI00102C1D7D|nr:LLM class flavin-dependent oxidoreductase [Streptomyces sp. BK239]RZU11698.1 alkanesulfonate monooxygenase SsuD/methylene tetrahydromethanopterin reductase-like flavin-dependent oxidoreductase (luciferase family) [Streptomyces sp. BK239]
MTSSPGRGLLHLAAAVDQAEAADAGRHVELVRLAERGGLDFVTLDDCPGSPGTDASAVLSRAAAVTHRVGLVPAHTGPSRVRAAVAAVAALDRISRGRAGWRLDAPAAEDRDGSAPVPLEALWREADAAEAAGAGEASGPAGAGRGGWGSEAASSRPVRVVDATEGHARAVAARYADVALVRAANADRARAVREELRAAAAESGRDPGSLRVLAGLLIDLGEGEHAAEPGHGGGGPRYSDLGPLYRGGPVDLAELIGTWHREGAADGFHLTPVEPRRDLERLVNGTVALLQHRGLFRTFYPGSTLREHLGLTRPAHRYAAPRGAA